MKESQKKKKREKRDSVAESCIFCKIANKEIKSQLVYEDDKVCAFSDINPQAPVHILVIPKKHIEKLSQLKSEKDLELLPHIYKVTNGIAKEKGIAERGYRVVVNCGPDSGQAVSHLHFHLFGGRIMKWPPG